MFLLKIPEIPVPITEISLQKNVRLFVKREDLIHPQISGNKYWKLLYNINNYLGQNPIDPLVITFGGAFSNHIAAAAAVGKELQAKTLGIIRGEELDELWHSNPTLAQAAEDGMQFRFVSRESYRNRELLSRELAGEFPHALIIPEGGTNPQAVKGIRLMLSPDTESFDYLCSAVGTGGTVAGLSAYAGNEQKILGFTIVNDISLQRKIYRLSGRYNFQLVEAHGNGYGRISDELVHFINNFYRNYRIPLDPVYTGKMMKKLMQMIIEGYFPDGSRILAFHTGGLQGIAGANSLLRKKNRPLITVDDNNL